MWQQGGNILGRVTYIAPSLQLSLETAALFHTPDEVHLKVYLINGIPLTLPSPWHCAGCRSSENCDNILAWVYCTLYNTY